MRYWPKTKIFTSPSSKFWRRANARSFNFPNLHGCNSTFINSFDKTKFSWFKTTMLRHPYEARWFCFTYRIWETVGRKIMWITQKILSRISEFSHEGLGTMAFSRIHKKTVAVSPICPGRVDQFSILSKFITRAPPINGQLVLIITTRLIGPQLNAPLGELLVLNENEDSSSGRSKINRYRSIMGCILSAYRICYWTYNHYIGQQ